MSKVKLGDTVKVHYTGKLDDGTIFDSSREREPFQVNLGAGNVIPGFENGIIGMEVGQSKTVTIPPEDGYGSRRQDLVVEVKEKDFPDNIEPEPGQRLRVKQADGSVVNVTVAGVDSGVITLDANHPLAGKTLTFEIELMEVT